VTHMSTAATIHTPTAEAARLNERILAIPR
jgi:hypothetical protein